MRKHIRSFAAVLLAELLALLPVGCRAPVNPPERPLRGERFDSIQEALTSSYLSLFDTASELNFAPNQIERVRDYLGEARDYCVARFEARADNYGKEIDQTQADLRNRTGSISEAERHDSHCEIQNLRILKSQAETLAQHAIPVAYENRKAKLKLIQEWPGDLKQIEDRIASGEYHNRKFGDVQDIGVRAVGEGQEDDVDDGRQAIEEMRRNDVLPPEIDNQYIQTYLERLANKIATNSDLRVPLKTTALNAKEINAFALPGGFLFVQRGLLEAADDEAELAGVIAHEIGHAAARHSHQLMRKAQISQIIFQATQIAATVLTGGAGGAGTHYALQYGFYGLGFVLNLNLLGVSRDFELEADRLGVQYAWNSGYEPSGFIRFFDEMATTEGYVNGASWFRTHPPFYERMVRSKEEMLYLPAKAGLMRDSAEFKRMKQELAKVTAKAEEDEKGKPSLVAPEQGCAPPQKLEYAAGQPIEVICTLPAAS